MISILYFTLPFFLTLGLAAIALKYSLQFLFWVFGWPNHATPSPAKGVSWLKPSPADILFCLASLAAMNLTMYWLPIYYWTTYTSCGDDRDGGLLFPALVFCPFSWILGVIFYIQVWRQDLAPLSKHCWAFRVAASTLLLVVLSTVVPQIKTWNMLFGI